MQKELEALKKLQPAGDDQPLGKAREEIRRYHEDLQTCRKEGETRQTELARLKAQLDEDARERPLEPDLEEAREALKLTQEKMVAAQKDRASKNNELKSNKKELLELRKDADVMDNDMRRLDREVSQLRAERGRAEHMARTLQAELDRLKKQVAKGKENEKFKEARDQTVRLEDHPGNLLTLGTDEAAKDLQEANDQIEHLQNQLSQYRSLGVEGVAKKCQEDLEDARDHVEDLQRRLNEYQELGVDGVAKKYQLAYQDSIAELVQRQFKIENLEQRLAAKKDEKCEEVLKEARDKVRQLEDQLSALP